MYEALRSNSIPVYISNDKWLPYKEVLDAIGSKLAVLVHIDDIDSLYNWLKGISDNQITEMLDYYHSVEPYFTLDSCNPHRVDLLLPLAAIQNSKKNGSRVSNLERKLNCNN